MTFSYSIEEACRLTGLGKTKLYEAINQGQLVARKFGSRTLIMREDIERFLATLEPYKPRKPI